MKSLSPPLRVALVEDHQMVRELIEPLLRDHFGHVLVGAAGTVAEGIALCLREKPDLVIVDWMLPDGRGFEVVRAVPTQKLGIRWIFISASEQAHVVREAVALKVPGFVFKRGSLDTLREAIREVSAGRSYYCPESSRLLVGRLVQEGLAPAALLSPRELEVLRAFAAGENLKVIAARAGMSVRTTQNHLSSIREKLGLQEPAQLVRYAIRLGLVEQP